MPNRAKIRWMRLLGLALIFGMVPIACVTTSGSPPGPASVAVWDPEALGPMTTAQKAMGAIIAAGIVDRFSQSSAYEVVERENLLKVLEEQNLGASELADDQTRLRLGRIIGCRQMVFGVYQVIGDTMRLDIRKVDVSTGKILKTAVGTVSSDAVGQWPDTARQAADELMQP